MTWDEMNWVKDAHWEQSPQEQPIHISPKCFSQKTLEQSPHRFNLLFPDAIVSFHFVTQTRHSNPRLQDFSAQPVVRLRPYSRLKTSFFGALGVLFCFSWHFLQISLAPHWSHFFEVDDLHSVQYDFPQEEQSQIGVPPLEHAQESQIQAGWFPIHFLSPLGEQSGHMRRDADQQLKSLEQRRQIEAGRHVEHGAKRGGCRGCVSIFCFFEGGSPRSTIKSFVESVARTTFATSTGSPVHSFWQMSLQRIRLHPSTRHGLNLSSSPLPLQGLQ
ncbi:hypothetical protein F5876DRAFT_69096 [Lentinula aff. lateritia]|uniref:Uncharacterized protein n=1 Tax=Lentinula aff. lateritia TaxID=2804960 RepID=A0ACC1TNY5_9AGAR|nr:hypothetical protein F5876DRAFT_69096 [Lentinula aff. lateritia]